MNATEKAIGGFSRPSKMPGLAFGIPAKECNVGSKLRGVKGSTCEKCYAMKGMYGFGNVQRAQEARLRLLRTDVNAWRESMISALRFAYRNKRGRRERVFRWHDSGDLQSSEHLAAIVAIAVAIPDIRFWLPTREYSLVGAWVNEFGAWPENLIVRVSAPMRGKPAPKIPGCVGSSVDNPAGTQCRAYTRGGECGACRKCWDPNVADVSYPLH